LSALQLPLEVEFTPRPFDTEQVLAGNRLPDPYLLILHRERRSLILPIVCIGFLHDHALQKVNGFPLELVVPSEGTGYEIGGLSIIKGARNMDNAKLFVDFMLSKEGQEVPQKVKMFQVPTNIHANVPKEAIRLDQVNLIDYDFVEYGSEEMRSKLIDRWAKEIKPMPR